MVVRSGGLRTWWHELAMTDQTWWKYELLHRDGGFGDGRKQDRLVKVISQLAAPLPAVFQHVFSE
jgi:hypothetical protein